MLKAFTIILILCAAPTTAPTQERYLVSYAGFGGFQAPAWAAKDLGLFTKYGLSTDLVMIPGSTTAPGVARRVRAARRPSQTP